MNGRRTGPAAAAVLAAALVAAAGCKEGAPPRAEPPPPKVTVAFPEVRDHEEYEDFNGWTGAVDTVEIRARVRGHIEKIHFDDGDFVRAGDVLFTLDRRPYQANVDAAIGQLKVFEAQKVAAEKELKRLRELLGKGGASQSQVEQSEANVASLEASAESQRRVIDRQRLEVEYCTVTAPLAGKVSRSALSEGNLVNAGGSETLLTTVVSVDPMHVYFTVPERTLLRIRGHRAADGGGVPTQRMSERKIPFRFGLETDSGHPRDGILDFADNVVDPETGTILLRGRAANADGFLVPGTRTRVRLVVGAPEKVTVVPDVALMADMDRRYVLVVGADGKVGRRNVRPGRLLDDGMRILLPAEKEGEGVSPADRVIIHGQQRARLLYPVEPLDASGKAAPADAPVAAAESRKEAPPPAELPPPKVTVALPGVRDHEEYEDFDGWTGAVDTVEIRARVRGHIEKIHFDDGDLVSAGDVLFTLDRRPHQAGVDAAIGQLKVFEAQKVAAEKELKRLREVLGKGGASESQVEQSEANVASLEASAESQRRVIDRQKLELEYCTVTTPLAGRVSRSALSEGNLVNAGGAETLLTTVVSVDPMHVYFTVPERTLLRIRGHRAADGGGVPTQRMSERKIPFRFGLENDDGHPREGILDFADNVVNPETGTILVRGRVANADGTLVPGTRTRVRLVVGAPEKVIVVPDAALLTDADGRHVLVVGPDGKVQRRGVCPGRLLDDGMRVLLPDEKEGEGVSPADRVIVQGQQQARIHYPVEPLDASGKAVPASASPPAAPPSGRK